MIIKAEKLGKRYGSFWALKDVSFETKGNILALLGPNGSGKTTLLSILAGLRKPSEGKAIVNDIEPYAERDKALKTISFMFEKPRFTLSIRVKDIVSIVGDERGCKDEAEELAKQLGINEFYEEKLFNLSSGQAQLVGLWVSLACWEGIVIIDEPFAHLDQRRIWLLADLIKKRKGGTILTTHSPEEAEALADYLVVLEKGRIIWNGSREELFSSNSFEIYPSSTEKTIEALKGIGCEEIINVGLTLIVRKCEEDKLLNLFRKGVIYGFKKAGVRNIYVKQYEKD